MRDHFSYSSEGRPEAQAFEEYVRLYSHGSDVTRGEGPFRARVRAWRHQGFILFDRHLTGLVHTRDARVESDGYAHFVLHAILEGELRWTASGGKTARPGDILFMDTTQPSQTVPVDAHLLTVSIGRHLLESTAGRVRPLHGRIVSPPATWLLTDFLVSLARRGPDLPDDENPVHARVLAELISAALFGDSVRGGSVARRLHAARLDAVERYIASNLADRSLSADTIAAATGLSRSVLYRLLQGRGGVGQLIRIRRLQSVRSAIDNGSDETLGELATRHGFASESHMSRQFHEAFGYPPGAYRRMIRDLPEGGALKEHRRWQGWMGNLR